MRMCVAAIHLHTHTHSIQLGAQRFHVQPMKSSAKRRHNKGFLGVRAEQISTWPFVPENLTWSLEWGQRGANLPAPTMERQPSSVTHSHSQTSFMCKSSLDPLFTPCAFQILAESSDICNDGAADMFLSEAVVVVVGVGGGDNKTANMFVRQELQPTCLGEILTI